MPRPGWFEHDPDVWWREIAEIARELLTGERRRDLAAVCFSGMGPCAGVVDAAGAPVRPAILYGIDSRAGAEIEELNEILGRDEVLSRCGSPLTSQSVGPKLMWLRRNEQDAWQRARRLVMPSSFAVLKATGEYVLDHHSASQCTPLYDLASGAWSDDTAALAAPGLELPRLVWPAELVGVVSEAAARETSIPPGTPVAAGTIDAWSEAVSAGVRRPGEMMLMYGSTMFMIGVTPQPRPDPHLWLTRWVFPGAYSRAAGLATSGLLAEWFSELTGVAVERLAEDAARIAPGAGGLVVLPYFAGERTPIFDPDARGVMVGLHLGTGRAHVHRALLEATAYAVRHNLEAMAAAGDAVDRVVAVGGGTNASVWTQTVSDVTGLPQVIPRETMGAAHGDAQLAGLAAGVIDTEAVWNQPAATVEPDPRARPAYDQLYGVYRRLYGETHAAAHELAAFQGREGARP
jgi:xylulokinase